MSAAKTTLESLITRYRREAARVDGKQGASMESPELEIRFQDVSYANFAAIYSALKAPEEGAHQHGPIGAGRLTQMVSVLMDARAAQGGAAPPLRPSRIREIYFEGGKKHRERYARKEPLLLPVRVPGAGLPYLIALSAERTDDQGFSSDEGALIRAKARVSFPLTLAGASEPKPCALEWRADLTVTREIMGSDADSALKSIVDRMFRTKPAMTPANLTAVLHLDDDANPAARELYRYEVEVEFVGPGDYRDAIRPADVTAAADVILRLANPEFEHEAALQAEVYRVAQLVIKAPGYRQRFRHELGLKRLLPQALSITRADYREIYPPAGLYLTDKADGRRAVALVHDGKGFVVSDVLLEYAPPGGATPELTSDTIVDGELVGDGGAGTAFYAFDVIAVAGEAVLQDGFEKRCDRLAEAVAILRAAGVPAAAKAYTHLTAKDPRGLQEEIQSVHAAPRPYRTDGLIFVEPGKPYDATVSYKWKSALDNTIDFLARRAPASVLGKAPFVDQPGHKLHFLFVGITPELFDSLGLQWCPGYADLFGQTGPLARGRDAPVDANTGSYFPIQFAPSDVPLAFVYQHPDASPLGEIDGTIVEGRCAGECQAAGGGAALVNWEMVRVRADRRRDLRSKSYYGNDFYAAEMAWLNNVDPFPVEQLWEGPTLAYFMRPKAGVYHAQTAVLSYVKTQRILSLKHADWVVDLGAGKGQDLGRYLQAQVRHLVAVDQDMAALSELVRYKFSAIRRAKSRPTSDEHGRAARAPHGGATVIYVLAADICAPYGATVKKLEVFGLRVASADAVVCNLAVHYFLASVEGMRNFVALARSIVKVGGQVVVTAFLGDAVHALFQDAGVPAGESWDLREHEVLKYSLKRLYASDTLEAAGQRIGVLLPFSDGRYYEEFLVNPAALTAAFVARGFKAAPISNAAKAIPAFEAHNVAVAALLTPGDRQYLSLYGELVFTREK